MAFRSPCQILNALLIAFASDLRSGVSDSYIYVPKRKVGEQICRRLELLKL